MSRRIRTRLAFQAIAAVAPLSAVQAAILAQEDFGVTPPPTSLPVLDASTGFGWAAGWTNQSGTGQRSNITGLTTRPAFQASLGDTGFLSLNERTGRNLDTSETGPFAAYLDPLGTIGKDGTVLYVAAVMGTSGPIDHYYGLEFHRSGINDAARILQVAAEIATAPAPVRGLDLRAYNAPSGAENFHTQTPLIGDYFVLKFEFGESDADQVSLYLNPPFHVVESSLTPIATVQATDLAFERISFGSFGPLPAKFVDFDDIRVAETWADVAGGVLTEPYQIWAFAQGLTGGTGPANGFEDDPDADGIQNGMEWILGMNPLSGETSTGVSVDRQSSGDIVVGFPMDEESIGEVTLNLQYDSDLEGTWSEIPITGANSGPDANGVVVEVDTTVSPPQVEVTLPAALSPSGRMFYRLSAVEIP